MNSEIAFLLLNEMLLHREYVFFTMWYNNASHNSPLHRRYNNIWVIDQLKDIGNNYRFTYILDSKPFK